MTKNPIPTEPNDDLADLIGSLLRAPTNRAPADFVPAAERAFTERCPKCGGSGNWRPGYPCFKCKGSGRITFKTSPDKRATARTSTQSRKQRSAAENLAAFKLAEPDIFAWFDGNTYPFAVAMRQAVEKYGSLTERQITAALSAIVKRDEARARVETAKQARAKQAQPVNVSALEQAFAKARETKKLPKLLVAGIKIYPAKADSANAGALYVRGGPGYLGKIMGGKFYRSRECTPQMETSVLAILADPKGKAIEAGRLTGTCAVCGRELTDPDSIAAGIGPICATGFGW